MESIQVDGGFLVEGLGSFSAPPLSLSIWTPWRIEQGSQSGNGDGDEARTADREGACASSACAPVNRRVACWPAPWPGDSGLRLAPEAPATGLGAWAAWARVAGEAGSVSSA